jgi:hypothetical protein
VWGDLIIGTPANPFRNRARIMLYGQEDLIMDNSLFLGQRCIGVLGSFTFVGTYRQTVWTRLAKTAKRGDSVLNLVDPVDWLPGENITVTSTVGLG